MKVGDLVRVKNFDNGLLDTIEMAKLVNERTPCLVINIKFDIGWAHVLEAGVKRAIPMNRLEVIKT